MKKLSHAEILNQRLDIDQALKAERHPISLFLDNIRSSYNVGSIFRTADSALLEKIYLTGFTPAPPRKEINKTALDAQETVPWEYFENPLDAIKKIKSQNIKLIALEITNSKKLYTNLQKNDYPLCIVLGNELTGISKEILEQCDEAIEIPMYGVKHSLNVSVSAGIAAYGALSAWHSLKK